jgi:hypothetical protein
MQYISTRGQTKPHTFSEAVEAGLAPDGGLFLPDKLPSIADKLTAWSKLTYPQLAAEFFTLFAPEISNAEWHQLSAEAYRRFDSPDVAPLRKITDKTYVLELFHGPTLAFKDFALQLLGLLYKRQVEQERQTPRRARRDLGRHGVGGNSWLPGARWHHYFHSLSQWPCGSVAGAPDGLHERGQRLRHPGSRHLR